MNALAKLLGPAILYLGVVAAIAQTPEAQPIPLPVGINLNDPQALLSFAASVNGLDAEAGKDVNATSITPWHLKASYETFDDNGSQTGTGVFEEWHISAKQWKRSYMGTRFTQTEYQTPDGHFYETDAGGAPWPESLIEHALVHPMPTAEDTEDTAPTLREQSFGKLKLTCVMLTQADLQKGLRLKWPLGLFPTYCFDTKDAILRFGLFDGSIQEILNRLTVFQKRYIASEIALSIDTKPLLHIHMIELRSMPADAVPLTPPATARNADIANVAVSSGVMTGSRIKGSDPQYPEEAKRSRTQGTVVMRATIGTDGRIHRLRVVSSPDSALSIAALAAVQRWVYKPYLLKGLPVSVETTINMVFNIGG